MATEPVSKPAAVTNPLATFATALTKGLPEYLAATQGTNPLATAATALPTSLPEYLVDAFQRSVLFLELLRERGNEQVEITSQPLATVLRFDHVILMSGRALPRPINYSLSRIIPPAGTIMGSPHETEKIVR